MCNIDRFNFSPRCSNKVSDVCQAGCEKLVSSCTHAIRQFFLIGVEVNKVLHVHQFIFSWERKLERTHTQLVYISVNTYIKESTEVNI